MRCASILLVMLASLAGAVSAQSRVTTDVDTTLVTVGDRITLRVTVEHPEGSVVAWPDSVSLAPFEVLDAALSPPATSGGVTTTTATFSLAAFELGELEIPSFDLTVLGADGGTEALATDRFGVEVVTVGADETGDIREIRGPLGIPIGTLNLMLIVLSLLLILALAGALYRRMRRAPEAQPVGKRAPLPRPAHELALEALAELEASPLLGRGQVKEYHIAVSEILRLYVERRYRIDALEMTTREVMTSLEESGAPHEVRTDLRTFLEKCDLVKFAKVRPDPDDSHRVLELGRALVERSIPSVPIPDIDMPEEDAGEPELVGVSEGPPGLDDEASSSHGEPD